MKRAVSSKQQEREFQEIRASSSGTEGAAAAQNGKIDPSKPPRPDKVVRRKFLKQYIAWLWPNRFRILGILLMALVVLSLDMVWPLGIKLIIDAVSNHQFRSWTIAQIGGAIAVLIALKQSLDSIRSYMTVVLNSRVVFRLRSRLFDKLMRLPLAELGDMKTGGIISRLSGDIDSVGGLVQMAIISPTAAGIRVILTVLILFVLSWRLAVAALIALPILAVSSYLWLRKVRPVYRSIREDAGAIDGRVGETFGGMRVVRAFRREKREKKNYALGHHTIIRKTLFASRVELVLEAVWGLLIPLTTLMLVWYGATLVLRKQATIGAIFSFQVYAVMLLQPIWQIVQSVSQTQRSLAAMERIFGVLDLPIDKPDPSDAIEAPRDVEEFRFDHVTFEYRPGVAVIDDFDLTVKGRQTIALVGPSGAGKTTITDLVARFHDPLAGRILLNGIDLRKIKLQSYRRLLAVVQQETFLFDGTVRENIAYGRRDAGDGEIEDAAHRANAMEFIVNLPEKFGTLIGERGFKLSGGQRQRISIARAILADPKILILDEATSNLDTESEQLIQASLAELYKNRTTFVIAHRLSTVTHADLIVAISDGKIIETGTHEELLERRGFYFEMVERQRKSFGHDLASGALSEV